MILKTKTKIEILWSFLGGFCFTVFVRLLEEASYKGSFDWHKDIFSTSEWIRFGRYFGIEDNLGHFIFGFLITYIIIWSVKIYKSN
tara:strand:- start:56 stop:313 length:258 start_codon:yes stop_codon:yes gene_type:complete